MVKSVTAEVTQTAAIVTVFLSSLAIIVDD